MIDLHSHILPGLDDGAGNLEISTEMARTYVAQGVKCVACTPHILPGLYHNSGREIRLATKELQQHLDAKDILLRLVSGADNHITPDFVSRLRNGHLLALADTRYVLVEPPHHVAPVKLENLFFDILAASYVPVLTHPERLTWIESDYQRIQKLAARGVWMQITSGSLLGRFGKRARYWAERMLSEEIVHILATDAHDVSRRPPDLLKGRMAAEKRIGAQKAEYLVATHPMIVLSNKTLRDCILTRDQPAGDGGQGNDKYVQIYNDRSGGRFVKRLRQFFSGQV
jgi:protein-tyrosine phosphatase